MSPLLTAFVYSADIRCLVPSHHEFGFFPRKLKPNQRRLVLEVSFLGDRLEVEIDDALVAKSGAN
jgi:hypothetical protein